MHLWQMIDISWRVCDQRYFEYIITDVTMTQTENWIDWTGRVNFVIQEIPYLKMKVD